MEAPVMRAPGAYTARTETPSREWRADLPSDRIDWCLDRIQHDTGAPGRPLVAIAPVAARTAAVYRISTTTHVYYLKCYRPSTSESELAERFARLGVAARVADLSPQIAPFRVIGSDVHLRTLLTAAVPGRSLLALHRDISLHFGIGAREAALRGWHGLGIWLGLLHWATQPPASSSSRARELASYTAARLAAWEALDGSSAALAARAREAVSALAALSESRSVVVTLAHGDVSPGNVFVGSRTAVIDQDDIATDMPGLDVSQALLEAREYGFAGSVVPLFRLGRQARAAFLAGYAHPVPAGVEFWLPHLRNLSVQLLTLASRRQDHARDRITETPHYRRAVHELDRSLRVIDASSGRAAHPDVPSWGPDTHAAGRRWRTP